LEARLLAATAARNTIRNGTNWRDLPIDRVRITPLGRALGADTRPLFVALLAAAALLVVLAALNASSLMASRSVDRRRELAVRRALGASRLDICRLVLVEAGVLVGAGTMVGLLAAAPALRFISALLPERLVLFRSAAIDWRILAFSVAVTAVLTIVVTIWPLRLANRVHGVHGAPEQARGMTSQARSWHWRVVVATQVGLALVLTLGGSLLVGSLLAVYANTPPVNTRDVLTIEVDFLGMSTTVAREAPERTARVNALLERVRGVPGVEAVALTAYHLLQRAYQPSGFVPLATALPQATVTHAVTADFYRIVQPHLVAGRYPTDIELTNDEPVVVVSERAARAFWPNQSALGQTVTHRPNRNTTSMAFTVVGVVKDVRWALWDEEATGTFYGPYSLLARQAQGTMFIRTAGGAAGVSREVVRVSTEADPLVRLSRVAPFDRLFVDSVRPRRFRAWLFGSFAVASLFVVGLGVLGQLAMSTSRRTREIGIRMTFGATRGGIARLIVREQLIPVVVGLVAGGLVGAWATRFVGSYLYQLTTSDSRIWASATMLILLTAGAGTLMPALRASRINPSEALKTD
jgi:predicted permease